MVVDDGPGARGLFDLREEREGELRVVRLRYRRRAAAAGYLLGVAAVARRLAREDGTVDLIHAHVHRMGWGAMLTGTLLRKPVVISEHSSEWTERTLKPAALRRARIAFRRAAVVCPVSLALQHAIEAHGVSARFRVVANAVDTSVFRPSAATRADAARELVNVALHRDVKGLDVLVRAFAAVSSHRDDLRLRLVGVGPRTPELRYLVERLGLGPRVEFCGPRDAAGVADALRGADVFVLSSRSETLGVAAIEALCCGVPVVATAVGGLPEAVQDGDGVLVPVGDEVALARGIETMLETYGSFDREAIARRAGARFSLEAIGRTWDEVYRWARAGGGESPWT